MISANFMFAVVVIDLVEKSPENMKALLPTASMRRWSVRDFDGELVGNDFTESKPSRGGQHCPFLCPRA